ncbi:4-phosphoerythronate dehydrogenase [Marinomonas piezotolerans]|uniref:Erythronate-4-phosphate dehydrogenase n=1 Tax=Marinomonas piezotolerans TaxID=2213058 RepID=A0A370UDT2_9GAMM|nr:4-phosphoerythronate dehydrogenase [Marinomonas piezotolerans]RDL45947.1 4-phosphoerythronate dehydrogenase [Marinomonas piezotolerans]
MKIIADENMPNVEKLFSALGDITFANGRSLTNSMIKDADVLLVRSVTKVNKTLLEGTSVKYVGSATIGTDHVDLDYLKEVGIGFNSAPGCNADAVADYVFSSLAHLYLNKQLNWLTSTIGIVGQGNVGQCVAARFAALGCSVVAYDPYTECAIQGVKLGSLEEVMRSDIISLHAPLTYTGQYPSADMIQGDLINTLQPGQTIISAGRGGVINESALMERYRALNGKLNLVFDVWDQEPTPNLSMAAICDIATPHIAGYSKQGREKGTWQIYNSLCEFFGLSVKSRFYDAVSSGSIEELHLNCELSRIESLSRAMLSIYDPSRDSNRFHQVMSSGSVSSFDWLRKYYVERDEFNTCKIIHPKYQQALTSIGFSE